MGNKSSKKNKKKPPIIAKTNVDKQNDVTVEQSTLSKSLSTHKRLRLLVFGYIRTECMNDKPLNDVCKMLYSSWLTIKSPQPIYKKYYYKTCSLTPLPMEIHLNIDDEFTSKILNVSKYQINYLLNENKSKIQSAFATNICETNFMSFTEIDFGTSCKAIVQVIALDINDDIICKSEWKQIHHILLVYHPAELYVDYNVDVNSISPPNNPQTDLGYMDYYDVLDQEKTEVNELLKQFVLTADDRNINMIQNEAREVQEQMDTTQQVIHALQNEINEMKNEMENVIHKKSTFVEWLDEFVEWVDEFVEWVDV